MENLQYRRDVDGLRGIAVTFVVLFHTFPNVFPGGFVGVDVFFVISGYLITNIIKKNLGKNSFSLIEFYAGRIRRLFPALLFTMAGCFIIGWFTLGFGDYGLLGKHIAAGAGFISNFVLFNEAGYFDRAAIEKPLLHLWSLAIEEQFYLLWPLTLLLIFRLKLKLAWCFSLLLLLSFSYNLYWSHHDANFAYLSPFTRFWELLIGAFVGLFISKDHQPTRVQNLILTCSFMGIVLSLLLISKNSIFPGWWAVIPTVSTALILKYSPNSGFFNRLLSRRPLVGLGLISYPLYLVHWPILSLWDLTALEQRNFLTSITIIFISVIAATGIFFLIEKPIRTRRSGKCSLFLLALMIIVGYVGYNAHKRDGLPFRPIVENQLQSNIQKYSTEPSNFISCQIQVDNHAPCVTDSNSKKKPVVFFWGDSTTANISYGLVPEVINELSIQPMVLMRAACPPIINYESKPTQPLLACAQFISQGLAAIDRLKPRVVVLSASWGGYLNGGEFKKLDLKQLSLTIDQIKERGVSKIILIGQFPITEMSQAQWGARRFIPNEINYSSQYIKKWITKADELMRNFSKNHSIEFISPLDYLCNSQGCQLSADSGKYIPMAYDSLHMTFPGAKFFVEKSMSTSTFR
jgi:peptidoglycan/LPS O-acetylase OafA/YrhL